ncbi:MAG: efflux RND transporter periplasmic adaptor subunit [Chitinophagales bacterium]|nr:efflux RND transporter periplasmic adaptor subunit [Chitinophagales bacterium]
MKSKINNRIVSAGHSLQAGFGALIILVLFFATGCSNKAADGQEGNEHGLEHADEHENDMTTSLTAEQIRTIGLEFGGIEQKQLTAALKANGILKVPNQNRATATTMAGGVIQTILVQAGNTVSKGQPVATITGTSFIIMQEEYIAVSAKLQLAESDFDRQQEMQRGNATSIKAFQQSEAELNSLKARKSSLQKQLELIGIKPSNLSSENIQSSVNIISPINGSVSEVMVNIGSFVETNTPIATIVDNSQLHLDLYVYEKDLSKLKDGQTIHFTLTNNPGKEYDARVFGISNTFEPNTKAVAVHAQVLGNRAGLIDGMSITAIVSLDNATVNAVPTEAIVNFEGQDFVFIVTDAHNEEEHHAAGDGDVHDDHGHLHAEKEQVAKSEEHNHVEGEAEAGHDEEGHKHEAEEKQVDATTFERIPVVKGTTDVGYSEITLLKDIPANAKIVTKGAFFILGKMTNAGEGHAH